MDLEPRFTELYVHPIKRKVHLHYEIMHTVLFTVAGYIKLGEDAGNPGPRIPKAL